MMLFTKTVSTTAPPFTPGSRALLELFFATLVLGFVLSLCGPSHAQQSQPAQPAAEELAEPGQHLQDTTPKLSREHAVLEVYADSAGRQRFAEATIGLGVAGGLLGLGFATQGDNMTLSHWMWAGSGVALVGSLTHYFMPSDLEKLRRRSGAMGSEELVADWKELAAQARRERLFGGTFGVLLGGAGITVGALVLSGDVAGDLSDLHRGGLGVALLGGGAASVGDGLISWLVPSQIERGYGAASGDYVRDLCFSAAPMPGGGMASVRGSF